MRTNSFTNNMRLKTDAELKTILKEKSKYTEQAIQAVIWELEDRNLIEKSEEPYIDPLKEEEISDTVVKESNINNNESNFEEFEKPFLYSKKSIQGFTIFFSTLFGTILLMSNLKVLKKQKARMQVLVFGISYTVLITIILNLYPQILFLSIIFNLIGYGVLVEYYWNKNIGKNFSYKKKQIWIPLIISIAITMLFVFLQFLPQILGV
ncbi:hypothetical protein [Polaribacter sp. Z022]|uniref:hypothetical protein n=1 Tax=Polaribacter sp. Z022 TaxID=2927125 RepID=UPI002020DF2E|nr:hypothetical protein [Polaribacter sp. Z022]MCL7753893.1 hypothetical protein [Polaribacter sp. Z022]